MSGWGSRGGWGDNFAELRRVRIRPLVGIKYKDKLNRMFAYDLVNNFNPTQHSLSPVEMYCDPRKFDPDFDSDFDPDSQRQRGGDIGERVSGKGKRFEMLRFRS